MIILLQVPLKTISGHVLRLIKDIVLVLKTQSKVKDVHCQPNLGEIFFPCLLNFCSNYCIFIIYFSKAWKWEVFFCRRFTTLLSQTLDSAQLWIRRIIFYRIHHLIFVTSPHLSLILQNFPRSPPILHNFAMNGGDALTRAQNRQSRRFSPPKLMRPTKLTETDKNRQKPILIIRKTDETDKCQQKMTLLTSFSSVFLNTG